MTPADTTVPHPPGRGAAGLLGRINPIRVRADGADQGPARAPTKRAGAGPAPPQQDRSLDTMIRRPVQLGLIVIVAFFVGFGGWATLAPLSSAAIAPGVLNPDGSRRTVQHLEGGIIRDILVRDGDYVEAGQMLVTLEGTSASAMVGMLRNQYFNLAALHARLVAEQRERVSIAFPDWLREIAQTSATVAEALTQQTELFRNRREAQEGRVGTLNQRIAQLNEEIRGLQAQINSQTTQLDLIAQEIEDVSFLLERGLERRSRLLSLERAQADLEGTRAENRAAIARARQAIGEAELQIITQQRTFQDEVAGQLSQVQGELAALEERLRASQDVLTRTQITAPVSGRVVQLRFRTAGGVIQPGEPILDIVPTEEDLIIDARVSPTDIDVVHEGLEAQVHLLAFAQRNLPRISGLVRTVSADAITDQNTGQSHFTVQVEVPRDELDKLGADIELAPGMPAEVLIITGERTLLNYFLTPITDTFRRGFREG